MLPRSDLERQLAAALLRERRHRALRWYFLSVGVCLGFLAGALILAFCQSSQ